MRRDGALRLTRKRLAWLERVEREGIVRLPKGAPSRWCGYIGLTEWVYREVATGRGIGVTMVEPDLSPAEWDYLGVRLTAEGRALMAEAKARAESGAWPGAGRPSWSYVARREKQRGRRPLQHAGP